MVGYDTPPSVLMLPAKRLRGEKGRDETKKKEENSKKFSLKQPGTRFANDIDSRTGGQEGAGGSRRETRCVY